jgi:hypothetical protein
MTTWFVSGDRRKDRGRQWFGIFVDAKSFGDELIAAIDRVAGTDRLSCGVVPLLPGAIPFDCRNVLFTSEKELYARVPHLDEAVTEALDEYDDDDD